MKKLLFFTALLLSFQMGWAMDDSNIDDFSLQLFNESDLIVPSLFVEDNNALQNTSQHFEDNNALQNTSQPVNSATMQAPSKKPSTKKFVQTFRCFECGIIFANRPDYNRHITSHDDTRKHKCEDCDYRSLTLECLLKHVKQQHKHTLPFQCLHCNTLFDGQLLLTKHMQTAHPNVVSSTVGPAAKYKAPGRRQPHPCTYTGCVFIAYSVSQLKTHEIEEHAEFSCNLCGYKCLRERALQIHTTLKHPDSQKKD